MQERSNLFGRPSGHRGTQHVGLALGQRGAPVSTATAPSSGSSTRRPAAIDRMRFGSAGAGASFSRKLFTWTLSARGSVSGGHTNLTTPRTRPGLVQSFLAGFLGSLSCLSRERNRMLRSMNAEHTVTVHRFEASLFPVNAYLVETGTSIVVVDATLGVSDGKALRSRVEALNKPLAAVIVTHAHPDHYGGISPLLDSADVPVYAVAGVNDVIRRDDAAKERILRPMFGDEWPATRSFPTRIVHGGERVSVADAVFAVTDLGPSESPHDSLWRLEGDGAPRVFVGDLVYSHMHAFLADGFYDRWLINLEQTTRDLPADAKLFMGHGQPVTGHDILRWQANYIQRFLEVLRSAVEHDGLHGDALADAVSARMKEFLPNDDLLFLMRLSVEPMCNRLRASQHQ